MTLKRIYLIKKLTFSFFDFGIFIEKLCTHFDVLVFEIKVIFQDPGRL